MRTIEANFDGLVGPTHNYGGLADGNVASAKNKGLISSPRAGVLEGLAKMKRLADAGLVQGVLPPHERPFLPRLRELGFSGSDKAIWDAAWAADPVLCRNLTSASPMWAANAAMVSPSADTADGRVHFTPANLHSTLHRSIEGPQTETALKAIFADDTHFAVHAPLPDQVAFSDEGAANHVRLCAEHGEEGVEILVFGRDAYEDYRGVFPARQTRQSCEAIARRHGLNPKRTVIVRQSQRAIDAGAFHNDVVCVGNGPVLFFHEFAFEDKAGTLAAIKAAAEDLFEPIFVEVPDSEVPLGDAITSYLFNSQLLSWPDYDRMVLIAPKETEECTSTREYCERLVAGNGPIGDVQYAEVRQSMRNGGGPACLRLRVVLSEEERAGVNPKCLMSETLYQELTAWGEKWYRDELGPNDLGDPALIVEAQGALDALTAILGLGRGFYPFQRG
ncbi:N-succinylarginine dihydrolase [Woodsholea maritima]|uniref:N-succinylarginine dihydrolase n=1 Tax=Woodsholea maritima TaxID=240237 RepID=UPI000380A232|nr:N-succinylarginine dihydrolase [Woodsholea maritima]